MPRYRSALPQLDGTVFLTDGGMETCLIYLDGIDLPCFASFPLVTDATGRNRLRRYFEPYLRTADEHGVGFILDTPTWRANADWGARLGYAAPALAEINRGAAYWAAGLRDAFATERTPIVVNGVVGPRGDGYRADARMTADDAERYHAAQIETFADTEVDMVSALTMSYAEEAIGAVRAAQARDLPVVISFTVETDGRLPSQQALPDAIEQVDQVTDRGPAYYMINCAHPTHFGDVLQAGAPWLDRVRGIRANASIRSHAELDAATELDSGDPAELGEQYRALRAQLPQLSVLGGCCGTDHRHVAAICEACLRS
ncbi:MAG TPA: homocysteine S-methyltransferase family protein [Dyella sp.]|nr:homocysteine S-methyltransferase family protein [Dyella sp.]